MYVCMYVCIYISIYLYLSIYVTHLPRGEDDKRRQPTLARVLLRAPRRPNEGHPPPPGQLGRAARAAVLELRVAPDAVEHPGHGAPDFAESTHDDGVRCHLKRNTKVECMRERKRLSGCGC